MMMPVAMGCRILVSKQYSSANLMQSFLETTRATKISGVKQEGRGVMFGVANWVPGEQTRAPGVELGVEVVLVEETGIATELIAAVDKKGCSEKLHVLVTVTVAVVARHFPSTLSLWHKVLINKIARYYVWFFCWHICWRCLSKKAIIFFDIFSPSFILLVPSCKFFRFLMRKLTRKINDTFNKTIQFETHCTASWINLARFLQKFSQKTYADFQ